MLISSFRPVPDVRFEGYCFIGSDYVAQPAGAEAYEQEKTGSIRPGEDGCYVVANPTGDGWEIGTDAWGMGKLFIYEKDGVWAAASSLHELAGHLRAHGVSLEPDVPTLRGLAIRHTLTNQLVSRQTVFRDIELMPTYQDLMVGAGGLRRISVTRRTPGTYEEALAAYIGIWRSRLLTILGDENSLVAADLSGGVDSRVVFAFLKSAGAAEIGAERFRLVSNRHNAEDFEPAQRIAADYGLALNGPGLPQRTPRDPVRALQAWRDTSLGLYMPVYMVEREFDPWSFQAHGAGGGNFRSPYAPGTGPAENLDRFRQYFTAEDFQSWSARAEADLREFSQVAPAIPPAVMHFRQFRGRMHFGHRPHRRAMFTPLNAAALDAVYELAEGKADRQVYFDVMESLLPGLMSYPYDTPSKAPHEDIMRSLTRVDLDSAGHRGSIYAPLPDGDSSSAATSPSAMSLWVDEAEAVLRRSEVTSFLGQTAVRDARTGIEDFRSATRPLRANSFSLMVLSYVQTVGFALAG